VDKAGNREDYHTCQVRIDTSGGSTDTIAPEVVASGLNDDWYYNRDVTLTLVAVDEQGGSGVESIAYAVDGVPGEANGASVEIPIAAEPNGVHTVVYHARDVAGNAGDDQVFRVTMDTGGPVGFGRDVRVRKGRSASLRYRFTDEYSTAIWALKVVVKNRRGRTVWSRQLARLTLKWTGETYSFKWKPAARGTFRYSVSCEDNADNVQSRKATGVVRVY
jgi:hypothetical protein